MKRRHADGIRSHLRPWDYWTDYNQATRADIRARRTCLTPEELEELDRLGELVPGWCEVRRPFV